jgi:hypothetical protein
VSEYLNDPQKNPSTAKLRGSAKRLPHTGQQPVLLAETAASAVFFDLEQTHSAIPSAIEGLTKLITTRSIKKLEPLPGHQDTYVITGTELRGVIARSAIAGAAQAVIAIAESKHEIMVLERELAGAVIQPGDAA